MAYNLKLAERIRAEAAGTLLEMKQGKIRGVKVPTIGV